MGDIPTTAVPTPHRKVALDYAVRLAVDTKLARCVYYEPCPRPDNPRNMKWMCRLASEGQPPMAQLYCYITAAGEVLHSYVHICHPFVGSSHDPFCKVCKLSMMDRVHVGSAKETLGDFFRWQHTSILEIPLDIAFGMVTTPYSGLNPHEQSISH